MINFNHTKEVTRSIETRYGRGFRKKLEAVIQIHETSGASRHFFRLTNHGDVFEHENYKVVKGYYDRTEAKKKKEEADVDTA
jgi:hypothetical protein